MHGLGTLTMSRLETWMSIRFEMHHDEIGGYSEKGSRFLVFI